MTASNRAKPGIVDGNLQPIIDPTQIYSGMIANVGVTFFGYNTPQNKGIGVALDNVQKVADAEPLGGGRVSAEDDFGALVQPAASYPGQPAQTYTAPAQPPFGASQTNPITGLPW